MELIKPIIRVGNSAGVVLPKEWLRGKARVELIERPIDIRKEVFEIVRDYLGSIKGIYLVGSYARGEESDKSDVDILILTSNINKRIKEGKYDIILIDEEYLKRELKKNALPLLPMIKEAKAFLNGALIEKYKSFGLTKRNLEFHFETTKSAMAVCKEMIELVKQIKNKVSDNIIYSLVLRLREAYIVDCLIKNKIAYAKGLFNLINKIGRDLEAYYAYMRSKRDEKSRESVDVRTVERIYFYILDKIKEQEKWAGRRKN